MRTRPFTFAITLILILTFSTTLAASAATGGLHYIQTVFDLGIRGPACAELSPDGKFLYVAGSYDDAVSVYRRSAVTGQLSFIQAIRDGASGANLLDGAAGLAVSPDGKHVYVASHTDDSLTVFSRDALTGMLTFVEAHQDGVGGIITLNGAYSVTVSPDNKHVYVTSYFDNVVSAFQRDTTTGRVTFWSGEGDVFGINKPMSVAVSPDGKHVYVANNEFDSVTVFERDSLTGDLTYKSTNTSATDLNGAVHLRFSPDGAHLYVACEDGNGVSVFQRSAASGALTHVESEFDGVGGEDGLQAARSVAVTHNGSYVYVAGDDDDAVAIFSRNPTSGALTYRGMVKNGVSGPTKMQSPSWITIDPDDQFLYVPGWSFSALIAFERQASDGDLILVQELVNADGLEGAFGVAASSNGCVYVASFLENCVVIFGKDTSTGELTRNNAVYNADVGDLMGATDVAVSPDGEHVYVVSHTSDALLAFDRVGCTWLEHIETHEDEPPSDGLDGARAVTVSPDGSLVYVVSDYDSALTIFNRNASTGELTFKQSVFDNATYGLDRANSIAISPDGVNIYITGYDEDAVTIFRWTSGVLGFEGVIWDSDPGMTGLYKPTDVAVSPDGSYVYVTSVLDDSVIRFWRNPSSGALTYQEIVRDNQNGVDGLNGATGLAISPDGRQLYVTGQHDDALAVFNRDTTNGSLSFVGAYENGVGGVAGLWSATGVAVSSGGAYVYVTGYDDNAISVFARYRAFLPFTVR